MKIKEIADSEIAKDYAKAEGDHKEFSYRGYVCEIKRIMPMGHLCGYIKKPGVHIDNHILNDTFHCGITYDEEDKVGFDCTHLGDLTPFKANMMHGELLFNDYDTYKTMNYVEEILTQSVDALLQGDSSD